MKIQHYIIIKWHFGRYFTVYSQWIYSINLKKDLKNWGTHSSCPIQKTALGRANQIDFQCVCVIKDVCVGRFVVLAHCSSPQNEGRVSFMMGVILISESHDGGNGMCPGTPEPFVPVTVKPAELIFTDVVNVVVTHSVVLSLCSCWSRGERLWERKPPVRERHKSSDFVGGLRQTSNSEVWWRS